VTVKVKTHASDSGPGMTSFSRSLDLHKRPRIREAFIQGFLIICGVLSILTTIGIVYELSKESLAFFTQQLWGNLNKTLIMDVDSKVLTFEVSVTGAAIKEGEIIRIQDEVMEIILVEGSWITV